jgi:methionyl-tRNA synthetase
MPRFYITTAIPYVNGDPHLGHALEFVQADVLARHRRLRGDAVRFLSGTDDNALKNVQAARAAGLEPAAFVAAKAARFEALKGPLSLSFDDFIKTSTDPRHRPGVDRLWQACAQAGDLYQKDYEGLYCSGCEAFLAEAELEAGLCPEHQRPPEHVAETNWFFRLSRYQDQLVELIESGRLRIEPVHRRNEVLAFIRSGLADFSVSRSRVRAHGWGVPVPGDPDQVVYVWFDALGNYVTALDYATQGEDFRQWWQEGDERLHVIGKGIIRFHAVYWPAILLSAQVALPTTVFVHDYLTVDGAKLSKSLGNAVDPVTLAARYGTDALRWWFLRDVPRNGDADFREPLLATRANELADGLVNRVVTLVAQNRPQGVTAAAGAGLDVSELPQTIDAALATCDLRRGAEALADAVQSANRFVSETRPWELAKAERGGEAEERLDAVLGTLWHALEVITTELEPFLPDAAARIEAVLESIDPALGKTLFPKFPNVPAPVNGKEGGWPPRQ